MLQALSSWHLVLFLFITSSLADWSLDSPSGGAGGGLDDPALQLRFDANPVVPSTVTDDFSTSEADAGVLNDLAQVSQDGNIGEVANVGIDPPTFQIASSGCSPPSSPPGKKRRRVRRGSDSTACPAGDMFKNTPSQFKFKQPAAEPGKQQTPTADPGSKTPPSANASPRKFIPKLSPEAEHLSRIFLPKENRPREDDYTCRKEGYYTPVCAHDNSEMLGQMNGGFVNFLDPCLPAPRSVACPLLLSKWCCRRVEIALTSLTEDLFAPFRQSLLTRPEISQTLESNANPFKFIGISCIQIPEGQEYLPAY